MGLRVILTSVFFYSLLFRMTYGLEGDDDKVPFIPNYVLANYFGSGIYAGGKLVMLNLPMTWTPEQPTQDKYRFRFPLSLGFYGLKIQVDDFDIPDDINIMTFAVGIEFDHWVNDNLKLKPFLDVGISDNYKEGHYAIVYAAGVSAYQYFTAFDERQVCMLRSQRASFQERRAGGSSDGFLSIEAGVDYTLPYRWNIFGRFLYTTTYIKLRWYFLDMIRENSMSREFGYEESAQELGLTLGLKKPIDLKVLSFERVGMGFSYSNGIRAFRLIFGFPLD